MTAATHSGGTDPAPSPGAQPLVSVCISAYNVERFLADTLGSVLGQTYRNLEIILVDNGSADRTFDVACSFVDPRFRCFRIPDNIGGYQAMNLVAGMASGEFIAIYHSDDVYDPAIIEKEVGHLLAYPEVAAVFTMYSFIDEDGRACGGVDLPEELARYRSLTNEQLLPYILLHGNPVLACPSFMIRRTALADVGPFDAERWDIAADLEMWLRIARRHPIAILDERLLHYRMTAQQWTARWKRLRIDPDRSIDVLEEYLDEGGLRSRLRPADLRELAYKRCDDETTRAANALILGDTALARTLLEGRYPLPTLLHNFRRRKLRVLLLRALMKAGLSAGAAAGLKRLLLATEYGQW